eukprot:1152238-Pelagomonas_calceolata.AAC.5
MSAQSKVLSPLGALTLLPPSKLHPSHATVGIHESACCDDVAPAIRKACVPTAPLLPTLLHDNGQHQQSYGCDRRHKNDMKLVWPQLGRGARQSIQGQL